MDKLTKLQIKYKVILYPQMRSKLKYDIEGVGEKSTANVIFGGRCSAYKASGFDDRLASIMSREDYLWCQAISSAISYFEERGKNIVVKAVDELYWKNKYNADGVARRLFIGRRTLYDYIDDFFETIHKYAIKNSAINIK